MFDFLAGIAIFILASMLSTIFHSKVEKMFPLTAMGVIIIIYLSGLYGNMLIGKYFIYGCIPIALIYIFIYRKKIVFSNIFTIGAIFYWTVLILAIFQNLYTYPNTWDELAQWAVSPKFSYTTHHFGAVTGSNCLYPDYPPGSAIFHYFWMSIGNSFQDNRLYISMTMLITVFLTPVLAMLEFKKIY